MVLRDEKVMDEYNRVSSERLQAKRACDTANGAADYEAKLKIFRNLDHLREDLVAQMRATK